MNYSDIYKFQSLKGSVLKSNFLKNHSDDEWFLRFLYYALNPKLTYKIADKTAKKIAEKVSDVDNKTSKFDDIFQCCEFLSSLNGVDESVLKDVQCFLSGLDNDEKNLYLMLLSKSLKLGVTAKTVNKVIPGLIPEWEVQGAYPIDKYPIKDNTDFWLTQKLNGFRATYYNGELVARSGLTYKGLDYIISDIDNSILGNYVLDGELLLKDREETSDNEAFRILSGILNSDNEYKTGICYTVFDIIPLEEFESEKPSIKYSKRREVLDIFGGLLKSDNVKILPVLYHGTDQSKISEYLDKMVREDKEGLVLNTDVPYKRKKHRGILKVKRFYTMDLPIIRYEEGTGRLQGTLGAFVLKYKDNEVKVGSGFTDEQRKQFWEHRDEMIGELCEVKYKEISKDKNTGLESLQFPVFVSIRNDKTEVSFG